jgi:hypothetical protein
LQALKVVDSPFRAFSLQLLENTVNRCKFFAPRPTFSFRTALILLGALAFGAFGLPAAAQSDLPAPVVREFPPTALRGAMIVRTPPEISMDGKADRLAPGARIRDSSNQFILTGPLANQRVLVNYTRDNIGQVQQVWILTAQEAALRRPNSPRSFFETLFGSSAPAMPVDNGNTPYNQLPAYRP